MFTDMKWSDIMTRHSEPTFSDFTLSSTNPVKIGFSLSSLKIHLLKCKIKVEGISPFCETTGSPILDFLLTSAPCKTHNFHFYGIR